MSDVSPCRALARTFILLLALPLLASCSHTEDMVFDPGTPDGGIGEGEYVIYRALFRPEGLPGKSSPEGGGQFVLHEYTRTWGWGSVDPEIFDYLKENMPALDPDTFADLAVKSETQAPLEDRFEFSSPVKLLSSQEYREIFIDGGGWQEFYHRYPNTGGIKELSRVGFNEELDQALVYFGTWCGGMCGAGQCHLLEKQGDIWVEIDSVLMWIS